MLTAATAREGLYEITWMIMDQSTREYLESLGIDEYSKIYILSQFRNYTMLKNGIHKLILSHQITSSIRLAAY